jgi:hypothetical protein
LPQWQTFDFAVDNVPFLTNPGHFLKKSPRDFALGQDRLAVLDRDHKVVLRLKAGSCTVPKAGQCFTPGPTSIG